MQLIERVAQIAMRDDEIPMASLASRSAGGVCPPGPRSNHAHKCGTFVTNLARW